MNPLLSLRLSLSRSRSRSLPPICCYFYWHGTAIPYHSNQNLNSSHYKCMYVDFVMTQWHLLFPSMLYTRVTKQMTLNQVVSDMRLAISLQHILSIPIAIIKQLKLAFVLRILSRFDERIPPMQQSNSIHFNDSGFCVCFSLALHLLHRHISF